jgi:hypothetical protein
MKSLLNQLKMMDVKSEKTEKKSAPKKKKLLKENLTSCLLNT